MLPVPSPPVRMSQGNAQAHQPQDKEARPATAWAAQGVQDRLNPKEPGKHGCSGQELDFICCCLLPPPHAHTHTHTLKWGAAVPLTVQDPGAPRQPVRRWYLLPPCSTTHPGAWPLQQGSPFQWSSSITPSIQLLQQVRPGVTGAFPSRARPELVMPRVPTSDARRRRQPISPPTPRVSRPGSGCLSRMMGSPPGGPEGDPKEEGQQSRERLPRERGPKQPG